MLIHFSLNIHPSHPSSEPSTSPNISTETPICTLRPSSTTPYPTTFHGDVRGTIPSVFLVCPAGWVNPGWPPYDGLSNIQYMALAVHPSATQPQFAGPVLGLQGQTIPINSVAGVVNDMAMFNADPLQEPHSQFNFGSQPLQSNIMDFASNGGSGDNSLQWPLGGQFSTTSDMTGDVSPPLLIGNGIPIPCTQLGCFVTFKRDSDRIRHEAAIHGINQGLYLCPVNGCSKSQGIGYTRKDKLTEHLWKKHGNLGFVKRTS